MTKVTIDSSVFLSSLLEGDRFHDESRLFFEQLKRQEVIIVEPITVLLEVGNILQKQGMRDIGKILDRMAQFQILELTLPMLADAHFVFQKCRLKTADAIVVWCASVSESILVSWDNQLVREAKKLAIAEKPTEYIKRSDATRELNIK